MEHDSHIYGCRHCEHHGIKTPIVTAKMPEPVFPGTLASPFPVAYTMTQKYGEGMPEYWNWIHCMQMRRLYKFYPSRNGPQHQYIWLYRTGQTDVPIVLYDYQQTRAAKHPRRFLEGFQGYLHVDGYPGYNALPDVTLVGCWAHVRRYFSEALKALPESAATTSVKTKEGLAFCNKFFDIERDLKDASPQERYEKRLERSQPVLEAFLAWLQEQTPRVLPKSALCKAIKYCRNQWERLKAFLKDGRLEIDNNRAERSIKPFIIGRKNWLFSNTTKGASLVIYSVVESAKENGLNPYNYLSHLFEELPNMDTTDKDRLAQLMPWSATLPEKCHVPNKSK